MFVGGDESFDDIRLQARRRTKFSRDDIDDLSHMYGETPDDVLSGRAANRARLHPMQEPPALGSLESDLSFETHFLPDIESSDTALRMTTAQGRAAWASHVGPENFVLFNNPLYSGPVSVDAALNICQHVTSRSTVAASGAVPATEPTHVYAEYEPAPGDWGMFNAAETMRIDAASRGAGIENEVYCADVGIQMRPGPAVTNALYEHSTHGFDNMHYGLSPVFEDARLEENADTVGCLHVFFISQSVLTCTKLTILERFPYLV